MAGASFSLLLLVTFISSGSAVVGTLEPVDDIIEVGTNLTLTCTLNPSSNGAHTAHDIVWYQYPTLLSQDSYTTISNTVSQLSLVNATFSDAGDYVCAFPGDLYYERLGSEVTVGSKPEPAMLECFVPSPDEYWCRWEEGAFTYIDTEHRFTFWHSGHWTDCPTSSASREDVNTCSVPLSFNTDVTQRVRVTSSNALGEANVEIRFNRQTDVVVNPPNNVELMKLDAGTSLRMTWDLPDKWNRLGSALNYKLRFKQDDCMMTNASCCCWTEILRVRPSGSLAYTLRDLDPYTFYSVQLAARYQDAGDENWSEWSEEVTARTRETAPTKAVQGLSARDEDNVADPVYLRDVRIWWVGLPEEIHLNGRVLGYNIILEPEGAGESRWESRQAWSVIRGLKKFSGYWIRVAAYNSAGVGPWSAVHVVDLTTVPNAPDEVKAVALTTTSILVEWKGPSKPNGYILHYIVEWGKSSRNKEPYTTPNASQLSYIIEGLETFDLYEVSVKASNSHGESMPKSVMGGARTLEGVPDAAPPNLEVKPIQNQPDRLTLMWKRLPDENVNGNLTGYLISFCQSSLYYDEATKKNCSGKVQQQNVPDPDAVTEIVTSLRPSTEYSVWLAAYTAVGMGPDSKPVLGKTAEETPGPRQRNIFFSVAVWLGVGVIAVCSCTLFVLWRRVYHSRSVKDKNQSKNGPHESSSKTEQERCDESVQSPHVAIISGLCENDNCEVASEVLQTSPTLDLIYKADIETKVVKFIVHSESGDSGVPPSPAADNPDFSALRDKLSLTEEGDDSVFLEDEDGELPSSKPEKLAVQIDSVERDEVMGNAQQFPEGPASISIFPN